jgi:hypothetical protein
MTNEQFFAKLVDALSVERRRILDNELNTDFDILKRQRCGEGAPPSRLYWAIKTLPNHLQRAYMHCLGEGKIEKCSPIINVLLDRERINDPLLLMEWAKSPSIEMPIQYEQMQANMIAFLQKTQYYEKYAKRLCKKAEIKRTFTAMYSNLTGRQMHHVGDSEYADETLIRVGEARISIRWDCGGFTHFREEIGIEWNGKEILPRQSICSWLGYYPCGGGGWMLITREDLVQAGHDAVQQTIQFVDILSQCALKAQS